MPCKPRVVQALLDTRQGAGPLQGFGPGHQQDGIAVKRGQSRQLVDTTRAEFDARKTGNGKGIDHDQSKSGSKPVKGMPWRGSAIQSATVSRQVL